LFKSLIKLTTLSLSWISSSDIEVFSEIATSYVVLIPVNLSWLILYQSSYFSILFEPFYIRVTLNNM
jgi:hypothetical protein